MSAAVMVVWYSVVCSPLSGTVPTLVTGDPRDPSMFNAWEGSARVDSESEETEEPVSEARPDNEVSTQGLPPVSEATPGTFR